MEKGFRLSVEELFAKAQSLYSEEIHWKLDKKTALVKLVEFFVGRVKNYFLSHGSDTLLVEAVTGAGCQDVWAASRRLAAMEEESRKPGFTETAQTFKRVANILRKQGADAPDGYNRELLREKPEMALAEALESMGAQFDALWQEDRFSELIAMLDGVRPAVDAFFDGVMVMDSDPAIRANRLGLLRALLTRMEKIADFSALQL